MAPNENVMDLVSPRLEFMLYHFRPEEEEQVEVKTKEDQGIFGKIKNFFTG